MGCTILGIQNRCLRTEFIWVAPFWAPESLPFFGNSFGCIIPGSRIIHFLRNLYVLHHWAPETLPFLRDCMGCTILGSRIIAFPKVVIWVAPLWDP